jgi:hypothetical protein
MLAGLFCMWRGGNIALLGGAACFCWRIRFGAAGPKSNPIAVGFAVPPERD